MKDRVHAFEAELEAAGAQDQLTEARGQSEAPLLEALTALQAGEAIDVTKVEAALDEFGPAVHTGDVELTAAWAELRAVMEDVLRIVAG